MGAADGTADDGFREIVQKLADRSLTGTNKSVHS